MFVANDKDGNRLYADFGIKYDECFCQKCGEPVIHKIGSGGKRPHFSHRSGSVCSYDKDYKSEWHIRIQEYFPKEAREVRFVDKETGNIHIADIFIKDSNTVIEVQHSPISKEEFIERTVFHINNNRRIAWLFDESTSNPESYGFGRFREDDCGWENGDYSNRCFKWLRKPRKIIQGFNLKQLNEYYSICVYTGTEGDVFHRIVGEHCAFDYVVFSLADIEMSENMNVDFFFGYDDYWWREDRKPQRMPYLPFTYKPKVNIRRNRGRF